MLQLRETTEPAPDLVPCYPETRIGLFRFFGETRTEPLGFVTSSSQRACGDSWPEVTSDLCLFTQEDPVFGPGSRYAYVMNDPLNSIDPTGKVIFRIAPTEYEPIDVNDMYRVCAWSNDTKGCAGARWNAGCICGCSGSNYFARVAIHAAPLIRYAYNHKTMSAARIIIEEEKHVTDYKHRLGAAASEAEALEQAPFGSLGACKKACDMWETRLTRSMASGNDYVHANDPHPE